MALSDKLSKYEGLEERFPQAQMSGLYLAGGATSPHSDRDERSGAEDLPKERAPDIT